MNMLRCKIAMTVEVAGTLLRRMIECRKARVGQEQNQEPPCTEDSGRGPVPAAQPFGPFCNQQEEGGDQLEHQSPVERIRLVAGCDQCHGDGQDEQEVDRPGPASHRELPDLQEDQGQDDSDLWPDRSDQVQRVHEDLEEDARCLQDIRAHDLQGVIDSHGRVVREEREIPEPIHRRVRAEQGT